MKMMAVHVYSIGWFGQTLWHVRTMMHEGHNLGAEFTECPEARVHGGENRWQSAIVGLSRGPQEAEGSLMYVGARSWGRT